MTTTNTSGTIKLHERQRRQGRDARAGRAVRKRERAQVAGQFEVNAAIGRKIETGEPFDAVVLNPPVLDELIKQSCSTPKPAPTSAAPA